VKKINEVIESVFLGLLGRKPDEKSLHYWTKNIIKGKHTLLEFISFLKNSDECLSNIDPAKYDYLLKLIYDKSKKGSVSGNPFLINYTSYNLFFLHIPKTAGISIINNFSEGYHPLQIKPLSYGDVIDNDLYKFFAGHFSINEIQSKDKEILKIISIREPKKRILSLYYFLRKVPVEDEVWGKVAWAAQNLSLKNFFAIDEPDIAFAFDNYYTRVLAGVGLPKNNLETSLDKSHIKIASDNLISFDHIIKLEDIVIDGFLKHNLCEDVKKKLGFAIKNTLPILNKSEIKINTDINDIPDRLVKYDYEVLNKFYQ